MLETLCDLKKVALNIRFDRVRADLTGEFIEKVFSAARSSGLDLHVEFLGKFKEDGLYWYRVIVSAAEEQKSAAETALLIPFDDWVV